MRTAIDAARGNSMPKENIERAVKKGTGELEGVDYQEITYEAYGPSGVALMIDTVTDNPTRTIAEIRHKLGRGGGTIGTPNSVAWMFEKKGQIAVSAQGQDEDSLMETALDAGAEDFQREDDQFVISTRPMDVHTIKGALEARGVAVAEVELAMVPKSTVKVEGKDASSLIKLLEELEDLDDVQKVWGNFEIDVNEMIDGG
jgi:YebC/PmpR family DNA-binding regulatory protein